MKNSDVRPSKKKSSSNSVGLWVGIAIVLVVVIVVAAKMAGPKTPAVTGTGGDAPAVASTDWVEGNRDAKVSLIEYGDFQCPACGSYFPIIKQLVADYGDRVQFVFRNYPLTTVHEAAQTSAESAEAAGLQGKYWEMNHWLYENQIKWSVVPLTAQTIINSEAESLGLNMDKFEKDREGDVVKKKIQADVDGANKIGVNHTPTFYVNLKEIPNPSSYDEFKAALDIALAGGTPASGTTTLNTNTNGSSTGTSSSQ